MILTSSFKPAWWLRNPHAQTLFPFLFRKVGMLAARRERLELPDGDFVDLVWVDTGVSVDAPLVVLLHGLGGTSESKYLRSQQHRYQQMGWRSVIMQFRGAGIEPNRKLRAYHSGDTADLSFFLHLLAEREPSTQKMGVGFSLGGNILLKWLGEHPEQTCLNAAVAVSVPFQLNLAADRLNQGFSRLYRNHLLHALRQHFRHKIEHHPNAEFAKMLNSCDCFWTFDDKITAPLNGFSGVHQYYHEASSRQYLIKIVIPTMIVHALDDPFMHPSAVPLLSELSPSIHLELSQHGGHVGFVSGDLPGRPVFWLDQRIPEFFVQQLGDAA